MKSNKTEIKVFLDELLSVFYHKFIYYVPNEIIIEKVLEQLKDDIDDDFFDEFYFIDNYLGSSKFYNSDALELNILLADKRSFLEQNTFRLVEKSKEITEFEFLVIIKKYYEFLLLFIYITEWLSVNLKKYNGEDIHLSIIGAFGIQMQYFRSHLEDVCNYFGRFIELEKEYDFSMKPFVMKYLSELISRYDEITSNNEEQSEKLENCNQETTQKQVDKTKVKKKKQRPELDEKKIEAMILSQVFNVNQKVLQH